MLQIYLQYLLSYILKFLICKHAGNPRVPPRVLASGPKPCGGNKFYIVESYSEIHETCLFDIRLSYMYVQRVKDLSPTVPVLMLFAQFLYIRKLQTHHKCPVY